MGILEGKAKGGSVAVGSGEDFVMEEMVEWHVHLWMLKLEFAGLRIFFFLRATNKRSFPICARFVKQSSIFFGLIIISLNAFNVAPMLLFFNEP